jgi:hypothetical protein
MASVALLLYLLPKMAHTGTRKLCSAVGSCGTVYLDIPAQGAGEVRITVSGIVSYVKARHVRGETLKAGTPIVVRKILDSNCVGVDATGTEGEADE